MLTLISEVRFSMPCVCLFNFHTGFFECLFLYLILIFCIVRVLHSYVQKSNEMRLEAVGVFFDVQVTVHRDKFL